MGVGCLVVHQSILRFHMTVLFNQVAGLSPGGVLRLTDSYRDFFVG